MKSSKESSLTVSFSLPEISFIRRKANLYAEENSGYLFIQYSGEAEIQERFNPQVVTELLKLFPEMQPSPDKAGKKQHGIYNLPEVDPHKVVSFLNRFGVVGISDLELRNEVIRKRDLPSITNLFGLDLIHAKKLYLGESLSKKALDRLNAIREGEEVPYRIVLKILKDLARSVRLYINLLNDSDFSKKDILVLNTKNRKRIVSAWNNFGGAFKDSEDPADSKFNLREEWTYKSGNVLHLDFAEGSLSQFSQVINKNLSLLSKLVITTQGVRDFNLQNTGLEVVFSGYLVQCFKDKKVKKTCVVCGSVFLPLRIKTENKYCPGSSCSKSVRNQRYRAKKKISATPAESKKTTKARKEKK